FPFMLPPPPISTLFPYTTLFRSRRSTCLCLHHFPSLCGGASDIFHPARYNTAYSVVPYLCTLLTFHELTLIQMFVESAFCEQTLDRKSTRLNSSHVSISYAVFCL